MPPLPTDLRNKLERTIIEARDTAEAGARAALEALAVHHHEPYPHQTPDERQLRNRLRAHARQLGDKRDPKTGTQSINRLVHECAYEHWHRMLFARFLAENDLLIEPSMGVAISLQECEELAKEAKTDLWAYASRCAQQMLPQIFRPDDPVLQVFLAPEHKRALEKMVMDLPVDVFTADDSLGWVYQFWQAERKDQVNKSGEKITGVTLPAVTQLFTEHYMVLFLLHNTIGAWWARKLISEGKISKDAWAKCRTEDDCRKLVSLPGYEFTYLRFIKNDTGEWFPAAGVFPGWPKSLKEFRLLDPCCGSGHFLVAAFILLVLLRMHDESFSTQDACDAVLQDNLHGLEIDPRCTQIAAFALALTAWKFTGSFRPLPPLNLACSGLGVNARKEDWLALANGDVRLCTGLEQLYELFQKAPELGSLINPRSFGNGNLLTASFAELQPLLTKVLQSEKARRNDDLNEIGVAAQGMARAAEVIGSQYQLVITNVPYLGRAKQGETLADFCKSQHPDAKADLGACFVERCIAYCANDGTAALVTPQTWLYLGPYRKMRKRILAEAGWDFVTWIGPRGFQTPMWDFNVVLIGLNRQLPTANRSFSALDVSDEGTPLTKASALVSQAVSCMSQMQQLRNPDSRILAQTLTDLPALAAYADSFKGLATGDLARFIFVFWEIGSVSNDWSFLQGSVTETIPYGGRNQIILWENGRGALYRFVAERLGPTGTGAWLRGEQAWGRKGVAVAQISSLTSTLFDGDLFDENTAAIIPKDPNHLPAIWGYSESKQFAEEVRKIDDSLKVPTLTLLKVPFNLHHWQRVAAEKFPNGLPKPSSNDPTQWLFSGHPVGSTAPLQVATARLLGYRWPRQTGQTVSGTPPVPDDGLEKFRDEDGIVCIPPMRGEEPAADRLLTLLGACGVKPDRDLDDWLRNTFFEEHCKLFHHRPFIWHIWDGRKRDGFHALVNYHKLAEGGGKGRHLLESLTYAYLGDWITRKRDGVQRGEGGAEERLVAALELQKRLISILEGEPPFDIFVRWKPLHDQPIGWEPDINDGVRINIRPLLASELPNGKKGTGILRSKPNIKWEKDRGKEPERTKADFPWFWGWDGKTVDFMGAKEFTGERFNDCHYTVATKRKTRELTEKSKDGGRR